MRAYLNEDTQMVEIFHGEPDEVIPADKFDKMMKVKALEEELAALKAELNMPQDKAPVEEPVKAVEEVSQEPLEELITEQEQESVPEQEEEVAEEAAPFPQVSEQTQAVATAGVSAPTYSIPVRKRI